MTRLDLASLLTPLPIAEFKEGFLGRRPLEPGEGAPDPRRANLFGWASFNRVLATAAAVCGAGPESPIEVTVAGRRLGPQVLCGPARPGQRQRIDPARLTHAVRGGGSLGLDDLEAFDPAIAHLCEDVSRHLRLSARARLWACWSSPWPPRFATASTDQIVIQLAGRCQWTPRESKVRRPTAHALEVGAVAYAPRGWSVRLTPVQYPVLQMVLSLTPPPEEEFRRWVASRLLEADATLREPLPKDPQERDAEETALLRRLTDACADPQQRAGFQADYDAAVVEVRPIFGFPWTPGRDVLPPNDVGLKLTGPRFPVVHPAPGGSAVFRMRGKSFELSAAVAATLSPLFEGRSLSVGELLAAGPPGAVRETLTTLLLAGHLAPVAPE